VVIGAAVLAIATVTLAVTAAAASAGPMTRDSAPPSARIVAPTPTSILDVAHAPAAVRPAEPAATARAPAPAASR